MKILVASYSRTGSTRKAAEIIAGKLDAADDTIEDLKNRAGLWGWLGGGKDALFGKKTRINFSKSPKEYDLVVVGSPVWAGRITPAARTYIESNNLRGIGFFCTYMDSSGKTEKIVTGLAGKPLAFLGLKGNNLDDSNEEIESFCGKLRDCTDKS